jgi:hypothetical protein
MFVSAFPSSSVYAFAFDPSGLMGLDFHVDQRWMLAIAWFRGWLGDYAEHPLVIEVREQVKTADYVTAPIADNSMFNTVNAFIEGEITDIQCQHSLSATNLGRQYVCLSLRALDALEMRQRCFLPESEKASYLETRRQESAVSNSKAKEAKRLFRNEGRYIEEVLS